MTGQELRVDKRDHISLPVQLKEGVSGCTRDLSASGAYLEMAGMQSVGDEINLTIEVSLEKQTVLLACRGVVVRVEDKGSRTGVAVRFLSSEISTIH